MVSEYLKRVFKYNDDDTIEATTTYFSDPLGATPSFSLAFKGTVFWGSWNDPG